MELILPNLYLLRNTPAGEPTPYTFFAIRPRGNIIFATKANITGFFGEIENQGGVSAILLGDRHHASSHTVDLARHFNVPLTCSDIEAKTLNSKDLHVSNPLSFSNQFFSEDIQIIPVPGHTPGAFAYVWDNEGCKILFIGDTLVPVDDGWQYWVSSPNRRKFAETLQMLESIEFEYMISNSFASTGNPCRKVSHTEKSAIINQAINDLLGE
ncbi:hypothetical protein [Pseudomonas sp. P9_31]|uniref:hypothetical protein n=1 Tax=Pseudomonas sp. P9_31 TaxID=3043448 RepID=UPI002A370AF9|nr:hypothetical protein [Pseudomonas sp. P9_31]WPN60162.1 hypothetical protein QMK51_11410 [Pseudomonas sp. P9_31]